MANNIQASLNVVFYIGGQPMRLVGTPQAGEVDGRSIFTTANTKQIFFWNSSGAQLTGSPGNAFSTYQVVAPGDGIVVAAKTGFELANFLPLPDATQNSAAMSALQSVIGGGNSPSPSPTPSVQGTIALTAPAAGASIAAGSVTVSGTYTVTSGTLTNGIQWRFNGGTWATLVASPTGGTFSASVNITTAATGLLEVRLADNTTVSANRTITITSAGGGGTTGTGTIGTISITTPASGASVPAGNVTIGGTLAYNSGQTSTRLEWQFNGGPWSALVYSPVAGAFENQVTIETAATGLLKVRFLEDTATAAEASVNLTVTAPTGIPAAVATQSFSIPVNGFTASELTTNWNAHKSEDAIVNIESGRFVPNGNDNGLGVGRASYKTPFQITSTAARFNFSAKVILDGTETGGTLTAQANYDQGFGVSIHNDLTTVLTANHPQGFGVRDLIKGIHVEFSPVTNRVEVWRNPSNFTFVGSAVAGAVATNGQIYGTVYVWIDLVQTTHVLNVFVANATTKPATPDLTVDLDAASGIGPLATYFGGQAFLAIGAKSNYTSAQAGARKPFRFETVTFSAANA